MSLLLLWLTASAQDLDDVDVGELDLESLMGDMAGSATSSAMGAGMPFDLGALFGGGMAPAGDDEEAAPPFDLGALIAPLLGGAAPSKPAPPGAAPAGPAVTWTSGPDTWVPPATAAMPVERTVPVLLPGRNVSWTGERPASPSVTGWEQAALACLPGAAADRRALADITFTPGSPPVVEVRLAEGVDEAELRSCLTQASEGRGDLSAGTAHLSLAPEPQHVDAPSGIIIHRR